jgi:hypothetical protein
VRSLLLLAFITGSAFMAVSCSDPIFWTLQNEKKIERGNLPKNTAAAEIWEGGTHYFARIGVTVWYKAIASPKSNWQRLSGTEGKARSLGGGKVLLSDRNIYAITDGAQPALGASTGTAAEGQMLDEKGAVQDASFVGLYNGSQVITINEAYSVDGSIISYKAGQGGFDKATIKTGSGNVEGAANALLDTSGNTAFSEIIGLYGTIGYGEIYLDSSTNEVKLRSPSVTVADKTAYEVSDLTGATVVGFYLAKTGNTFFVLTSNRGLWRNTDGVWYWE